MWLAVAAVGCVGGIVGHVLTRAVQSGRDKAEQAPTNVPIDLEEVLRPLRERHAALEVRRPTKGGNRA